MIVDLFLLGGAILSIGVGYNKGLIASLFSVIGYLEGELPLFYSSWITPKGGKYPSRSLACTSSAFLSGLDLVDQSCKV